MLVSQTLSPVALQNSAKPAFRYLGHTISYKEFWETASRFSYFLQKEIGHGLRVGLWMSNCPHIAYSFIALANTKSCTVPLNPEASPQENLFKIKDSGVTVILCSSDYVKKLKDFLHENGLSSINVMDMESKRCAEYDPSYTPPASHQPNENDDILLFYTPGSTGKYKGCLFNHKAVSYAMTSVKGAYRIIGTDVFFTQLHYSSPFTFIHFLLAPLMGAANVFISDQTDYKTVLEALTESRVTRFAPQKRLVPEMLKFSEAEKLPIVTVKQFIFCGNTLAKETWEHLKRISKANPVHVYNMTEYLGTVAMSTPDIPAKTDALDFIGPALAGTKVRVVDDNNDEIDKKKQQKGQLLVMGPALMTKYHELPDEQKMTVRGTWLFTGDLCEIDKDGNLIFLERKADVVTLPNAEQVLPKDIEPYVLQIPQVEEAAYILARDRLKKPLPAVVIVRKPQAALNEKAVTDYLTQKVTKERVPKAVLFIDAMPKTISGNINRMKLRSLFDGI